MSNCKMHKCNICSKRNRGQTKNQREHKRQKIQESQVLSEISVSHSRLPPSQLYRHHSIEVMFSTPFCARVVGFNNASFAALRSSIILFPFYAQWTSLRIQERAKRVELTKINYYFVEIRAWHVLCSYRRENDGERDLFLLRLGRYFACISFIHIRQR